MLSKIKKIMSHNNLKEMSNALDKALATMTKEQIEEFFPPRDIPKGWVSIEDHLPMWLAMDVAQGYTSYKVKDANGKESTAQVADHNVWYYFAKEQGITHWWNE